MPAVVSKFAKDSASHNLAVLAEALAWHSATNVGERSTTGNTSFKKSSSSSSWVHFEGAVPTSAISNGHGLPE